MAGYPHLGLQEFTRAVRVIQHVAVGIDHDMRGGMPSQHLAFDRRVQRRADRITWAVRETGQAGSLQGPR
ncbi:hypothetical protein D3C78_1673620 [compost metagenome]